MGTRSLAAATCRRADSISSPNALSCIATPTTVGLLSPCTRSSSIVKHVLDRPHFIRNVLLTNQMRVRKLIRPSTSILGWCRLYVNRLTRQVLFTLLMHRDTSWNYVITSARYHCWPNSSWQHCLATPRAEPGQTGQCRQKRTFDVKHSNRCNNLTSLQTHIDTVMTSLSHAPIGG